MVRRKPMNLGMDGLTIIFTQARLSVGSNVGSSLVLRATLTLM
jgi:hypothetical protein